MQLTEIENTLFHKATSDFRRDHESALRVTREKFNIPENRFFSVRSDGKVTIDLTRKRVVESRKISKSDL